MFFKIFLWILRNFKNNIYSRTQGRSQVLIQTLRDIAKNVDYGVIIDADVIIVTPRKNTKNFKYCAIL